MCSILSERRGSIYQYVINFYMKIEFPEPLWFFPEYFIETAIYTN